MAATLTGNELLVLYLLPPDGNYETTPDGYPVLTPFITTVLELSAILNGGSGINSEVDVNSGTIATVLQKNVLVNWNSSTPGNKTLIIPQSTGTLGQIVIADIAGTAGTYPITPVPVVGSVLGNPQVYTNGSTMTLLDSSLGWIEY